MELKLNEAAKEIHNAAKEKGFWDNPRETGTLLMLCVSELAEAMEADRKDRFANIGKFKGFWNPTSNMSHGEYVSQIAIPSFESQIKDSFEDELADTVIRILDLCGAKGIDLEWHIEQKIKYNKTREKMHGKRY